MVGFRGPITKAKEYPKVEKDIQKLFREPTPGLWFHRLESVTNSSINSTIRILTQNIQTGLAKHGKDIGSSSLNLHICVLKYGFSLHTKINPKIITSLSVDCLTSVDYESFKREIGIGSRHSRAGNI